MKTTFLLTTPTSATSSMIRITRAILGDDYKYIRYFDEVEKELKAEDLERTKPPLEGHLLFHNAPHRFNKKLNLDDYRFIVNFRDPRDRICNEYYWEFSHPKKETEEQRSARIGRVKELGIDNWILDRIAKPHPANFYDNIFWVLENSSDYVVATYAQLCCDFDLLVKNISTFSKVSLTEEILETLQPERPEAIEEHPQWIGASWVGSDIMPGRYKRELRADTIEKLNLYFSEVLHKMAIYDPDFKQQYLEGVRSDHVRSETENSDYDQGGQLKILVKGVEISMRLSETDEEIRRVIDLAKSLA